MLPPMLRVCLVVLCLWSCLPAVEDGAPWLPALAALTDPRPAVHHPAMEALIRHGPAAVADVSSLGFDADWELRARVATVLAGIGGSEAGATLVRQAVDQDARVREVVAAALGKTPAPGVVEALQGLARDPERRVRQAAITGLGTLGDPAGLVTLVRGAESDPPALRGVRAAALRSLLNRPDRVALAAQALGDLRGAERRMVLDAVTVIGDPRLTPALVEVLRSGDDLDAAHAARALLLNGDSRALEALCALAADATRIQPARVAADTLVAMTGVSAAAGGTWAIWWREHAAEVEALYGRDAFIAEAHDPEAVISPLRLRSFSPELLMPLIDGVLGEGAWWWRQRAGRILLSDDPARWTPVLLRRIETSSSGEERLALIILLDQYGDPGAADGLARLYAQREAAAVAGRNDPERAALAIALERRGRRPAPRFPTPAPRSTP